MLKSAYLPAQFDVSEVDKCLALDDAVELKNHINQIALDPDSSY